MPSDDNQPADQAHAPAAHPDVEPAAETSAPRYTLGQPHPSWTHSIDESLAGVDTEDLQRPLQHLQDMISYVAQAARLMVDQAAGLRSIAVIMAAVATQAVQFRDAWSDQIAHALGTFASILHDLPATIMRAEGPPNWNGLTDEELKAVIVTAMSGVPVSWVPRTAILRELLAAGATDRLAVLDAHANDIVADCAVAVSETRFGMFSTLATCTEEAILTYRNGHLIASQALSASVFDTLLRDAVLPPVKRGYYPKVKEKITKDPNCLPWVIAHLPALEALQNFDHPIIPTTFNRHAAAHAVSAEQYTPSNALVSLMLASSILRQAHRTAHEVPEEDDPYERPAG